MNHSWRPTLDAGTGMSVCGNGCGRVWYALHPRPLDLCDPARFTAWGVYIDVERAEAVKRWKQAGLSYVQIAELASSWDVPNDESLYFGVMQFGRTVSETSALVLGEIEGDW